MKTRIFITFNDGDGTVSLSNSKGVIPIAKIKNDVVSLDTSNKEAAFRVGRLIQHIGIDIQRLVETT